MVDTRPAEEEDEEEKRKKAAIEEDPDFDPDNMVIRGAPIDTTDDETEVDGGDKLDGGGDINTASTIAPQQLAFSNVVHTTRECRPPKRFTRRESERETEA